MNLSEGNSVRIPQGQEKRGSARVQKKPDRKPRTAFSVEKDIILLKLAIAKNPWQLGDKLWSEVVEVLNTAHGFKVTQRTVKSRIELLLKKMSNEELSTKTGTDEEQTERGDLLQEVLSLIEESKVTISSFSTATNDDKSLENDEELEVKKDTKKARRQEIAEANEERDILLNNMAPEPNSIRPKRGKFSLEEDLIVKKQTHDMVIDKERLQIERDRLDLEKQREIRICEENTRRDELAQSQIDLQKKLLEMMASFIRKDC